MYTVHYRLQNGSSEFKIILRSTDLIFYCLFSKQKWFMFGDNVTSFKNCIYCALFKLYLLTISRRAWKLHNYYRVKCVERDTQSLCLERDTPGFFFNKRPLEGYINKMCIFSWFCAVVHIMIGRIANRNFRSFHVIRRYWACENIWPPKLFLLLLLIFLMTELSPWRNKTDFFLPKWSSTN